MQHDFNKIFLVFAVVRESSANVIIAYVVESMLCNIHNLHWDVSNCTHLCFDFYQPASRVVRTSLSSSDTVGRIHSCGMHKLSSGVL